MVNEVGGLGCGGFKVESASRRPGRAAHLAVDFRTPLDEARAWNGVRASEISLRPTSLDQRTVIARSAAPKQSSWITTARFAPLATTNVEKLRDVGMCASNWAGKRPRSRFGLVKPPDLFSGHAERRELQTCAALGWGAAEKVRRERCGPRLKSQLTSEGAA